MGKMKEIRLEGEPIVDRKGNTIPVTRVVAIDESRDYSKAPGNREIARRRRQHAHTASTAR